MCVNVPRNDYYLNIELCVYVWMVIGTIKKYRWCHAPTRAYTLFFQQTSTSWSLNNSIFKYICAACEVVSEYCVGWESTPDQRNCQLFRSGKTERHTTQQLNDITDKDKYNISRSVYYGHIWDKQLVCWKCTKRCSLWGWGLGSEVISRNAVGCFDHMACA